MNLTNAPKPTVFVVDDDEAVRDSITWLLEANRDYEVRTFPSGEDFLSSFNAQHTGLLILDVRMPGMSGLELQNRLIEEGNGKDFTLPIVFITGHGDVPMAVAAMKKGAVDFIQKPFDEMELRQTVERLITQAKAAALLHQKHRVSQENLARLTRRECQVLDCIVAGRRNKEIADDLNISIKTVEAHRTNLMDKLGASNVAELLKMVLAA